MKKTGVFVLLAVMMMCVIIGFTSQTGSADFEKEVTLLFTHDLHDNFLPFWDDQDGMPVKVGGYARLMSAILSERTKAPGAILLDAGDFSMGTPFQTLFATDAPGLLLMGKMGYDAVTLGNHEFDYRAQSLADCLMAAKRSGGPLPAIVAANIHFPAISDGAVSSSLANLQAAFAQYGVKDYLLLERNGLRIGVFGLMGVDSASKAPMSEVKFTDPVENARRVVDILKTQEKADLIVCLSHGGTWPDTAKSEDETLAKKVPEIDVIISGHTHTKLHEPKIAGRTIIVSAEDSGRFLGVLKVNQTDSGWSISDFRLLPVDSSWPEHPDIAMEIEKYKRQTDTEYFLHFGLHYDQILAYAPFRFETVKEMYGKHGESRLGNLISDAYIHAVRKAEGADYHPVAAAIVPIGTIRSTIFQGDVTAADVFCISSLGIGADKVAGYPLISVYLTGKELKTVCEVDASVSPLMEDAQLNMAGIRFTFNPHRLIFNKVTNVSLLDQDLTEQEIDEKKLYRVVAGLYSAQMLGVVGEKSFGLLSIIPKTQNGEPVTDFEALIVRDAASGSEVKEWLALAGYLQSFTKVNGIARIPEHYNRTDGRKIVDSSLNPIALLGSPNTVAAVVYAVITVFLALIIYLVYRIRRRRQAMKKKARELS